MIYKIPYSETVIHCNEIATVGLGGYSVGDAAYECVTITFSGGHCHNVYTNNRLTNKDIRKIYDDLINILKK